LLQFGVSFFLVALPGGNKDTPNSVPLASDSCGECGAFAGIQHAITPKTLDGALALIKQSIDHRDNKIG
jgi:hypothetical protein